MVYGRYNELVHGGLVMVYQPMFTSLGGPIRWYSHFNAHGPNGVRDFSARISQSASVCWKKTNMTINRIEIGTEIGTFIYIYLTYLNCPTDINWWFSHWNPQKPWFSIQFWVGSAAPMASIFGASSSSTPSASPSIFGTPGASYLVDEKLQNSPRLEISGLNLSKTMLFASYNQQEKVIYGDISYPWL